MVRNASSRKQVQIADAEEVGQGLFHFFGGIDFALAQAVAQFVHGDVNVDDFIGALEKAVGNGLADDGIGRTIDGVVQGLEVLDVDCGQDVDARVEQLEHIFVALAVLAAGNVGVGQLVNHHGVGVTLDDRVDIHFLQLDTAVGDDAQGNDFEVANARPGFLAAVRFNESDDEVDALLVPHAVGIVEHHVGLANAGCGADVDAQLARFLLGLQLELGHRSAHLDRMTDRFDRRDGKSKTESGTVTETAFHSDLAAE